MKLAAVGVFLVMSFLPVNPGYLVYTNDSYNFSIEYPENWTMAEGGQDVNSNPPEYVTSVVTFYPPQGNRSSQYDSFTVAFARSSLASSDPVNLTKYMDYGLRHYYEELPYSNGRGGSYTNVSDYPAIETNVTYYYNTWVKLRGQTYFIIAGQQKSSDGLYRPIICRLEYRTSDETFNNHLETAMRMIGSFKLK